jgi:hypothetical protein
VQRNELLEADLPLDLIDEGVPPLGGTDVVAGGEGVARVDTDGDALRLLNVAENAGKLGDRPPDG